MDPTVPSSKKFLRQLPGYKPTVKEQKFDDNLYKYGINKMENGNDRENRFNPKKNELIE